MNLIQKPTSETSKRHFAGAKISKVRWASDTDEKADIFLTGTWNSPVNNVTLWRIQRNYESGEDNNLNSGVFSKKMEFLVGGDVNDMCVIPKKRAAVALETGDVVLLDISSRSDLVHLHTYHTTEKCHAATALCILDDQMFVGTEAGAIMRVPLVKSSKPSYLARELTTVRCIQTCGPSQFVTGHDTSQLHFWDLRVFNPAKTVYPTSTKAASSFNDAITALASHPAEPNLIAYGTQSGSVGFLDVRKSEAQMPSMLTVSTDSINELKFHPAYANNCFSSTQNGLIHWDATNLGKHTIRPLTSASMDIDLIEQRDNPWLMANAYSLITLTELLEDDFKFISTFDVAPNAIIVGSDSATLALIEDTKFL